MKKQHFLIMTFLLLCSGCGKAASDEITTTKAVPSTEKTTKAEIKTISDITTEISTIEISTAPEVATQDPKEALLSSDRILEAYVDYADDVGTGNFEACVNLVQAKFEGEKYSINITEPTDEAIGSIKVTDTDGCSLYIGFYPHPRLNQEMITTVEYTLNNDVSVSVTNDYNFSISAPKIYKTRDANRTEATQMVSNIDEQIEFIASFNK